MMTRILAPFLSIIFIFQSSFSVANDHDETFIIQKQIEVLEHISLNHQDQIVEMRAWVRLFLKELKDASEQSEYRDYYSSLLHLNKELNDPSTTLEKIRFLQQALVEAYKKQEQSFWEKAYDFLTGPWGVTMAILASGSATYFFWDHIKGLFVLTPMKTTRLEYAKLVEENDWTESLIMRAINEDNIQSIIGLRNSYGESAFYWAAINKEHEIVKALLKSPFMTKKEFMAANNVGNTPLNFVSYMGHLKIIKLILKHKFMSSELLKKQNRYKISPLIFASMEGNSDVVHELLKSSHMTIKIIKMRGRNGLTARDFAEENGHIDIIDAIDRAIESKK